MTSPESGFKRSCANVAALERRYWLLLKESAVAAVSKSSYPLSALSKLKEQTSMVLIIKNPEVKFLL